MNPKSGTNDAQSGPWNPGVESPVPSRLRPLCTIFRPANVYTPYAEARELRELTGLDYTDLVAFRPERLALHELLIRVTADFSVPDGEKIEDLGINFRRITRDILERDLEPRRAEIAALYDACTTRLRALITSELAALFPSAPHTCDPAPHLARWEASAHTSQDRLQKSACRALWQVVSALLARHGRVWGTAELIASVACNIAGNDFAGEEIGRAMEPWLKSAAGRGEHRLLPAQASPVVMNTKGASASGKSTIRPLQKRLAGDIGTSWSEFALISPDIWRKQLLDYSTLGAAYKYAGAFTGDELSIVDRKLDAYMARKAERGHMPHLLIDRFRFDSFAPDSDVAGSNLLTRFGRTVYLFFMITPPDALVERAWTRGLDVGRYKAVDDTLAHAVEAYSGMPELFFTWVQHRDKRVHFEFLDNSVQHGERPRTVAFGWNDVLNVLDVKCMLDVERYRRIDIDAREPGALFRDARLLEPANNMRFLRQCMERFGEVHFADQATGRIYLRLTAGAPVWLDRAALAHAAQDADTRAGLEAVAPRALEGALAPDAAAGPSTDLASERIHTVGRWGTHDPGQSGERRSGDLHDGT